MTTGIQEIFAQQAAAFDAPEPVEEERFRWVTFRLGEETYGIDVLRVQEVQRLSDIAPVPGSPAFVLGIFNLRGTVVTVLDGNLRFGMSSREPTEASRIMIVDVDDTAVGLRVDAVAEVVEVPVSRVYATPKVNSQADARFLQGVAHHDERLILLVDSDRLLRDDDESGLL